MTTTTIKEQLNKNRQNKTQTIKKVSDVEEVKVLTRLQVAKIGSVNFFTHIAIVSKRVESGKVNHYFVNYNGTLPINNLHGDECSTTVLSNTKVNIILDVIHNNEKYKSYHLNTYTSLILGCLYRGVDLIKEGDLKL